MKILDIINEASLRDILPKEKPSSGKVQAPGYTGKGDGKSGSSRRDMRPKGVAIEHPDYVYNMVDSSSPDGIRKLSPGEESWNAWYDHKGARLTHRRDFTPEQKQQIIRNQEMAKKNNSFNLIPKEGESWRTTDGMGKSQAKVSNASDGTNAAFDAKSAEMAVEVDKTYEIYLKKTGSEEKARAAADNKVAVLAQKSGVPPTQIRNLAQSVRGKTGEKTTQASWQFSGKGGKEAGYDDPNRVASPALHDLIISKNPAVATPAWREFQRRLQLFDETGKRGNDVSKDPEVINYRNEANKAVQSEVGRNGNEGSLEDTIDKNDRSTKTGLTDGKSGSAGAMNKSQQARQQAENMKNDPKYDEMDSAQLRKNATAINSDRKWRSRMALKRRGEPYAG